MLHQTTLSLSHNSGLCEAAISILLSHIVVTEVHCQVEDVQGLVTKAELEHTQEPANQLCGNLWIFIQVSLGELQINSDYTLNMPCLAQCGHKVSALEEKTDMKRPIAWSNTSTAAVVSVAAWRTHEADKACQQNCMWGPKEL